ncbi:MAG: hypothetical protein RLZZ387_3446 [Chloroflexota bacterium]
MSAQRPADQPIHAAVAELATILYGEGPTGRPLDDFGPIYATAVQLVRDAFSDAARDLLRGLPGDDPQAAAHRAWAGIRDMTGTATNFRPLALLLDQAAHSHPGPLPRTFPELLAAIARAPAPQAVKALLLRLADDPPPLSRADWLRLTDLLVTQVGLDAAWVAEWRQAVVAAPPRPAPAPAPRAAPVTPRPEHLALAHHRAPPPPPDDGPRRWRILDEDAIDALRPPTWLVKGIIPAAEVTVIAGPGDAGKTFVMVDIVNRVARHYPVIYVAGEDAAGIRVRKRAWELHHRARRTGNFRLMDEALPLADPLAVESFIAAAAPIQPRLIVIDTLSQSIAGADENSSAVMSAVLANAQRIARALGAAVVLIHHYTKDGSTYRGSSVLKNNTYGFLEVERDSDDLVRLECNRIKNAPPFAARYFRLVEAATDIAGDEDAPTVSCVIMPARKVVRGAGDLSKVEVKILELLLSATDADGGMVTTALQQELGLKGRSFYGPLAHLRKHGYIVKEGDKRTSPLIVTEWGRAQLGRHSGHPDHQPSAASTEEEVTFEVNPKLLPLLPGSSAGGSNAEASWEETPHGDAGPTRAVAVAPTVASAAGAEQDDIHAVASSYSHVTSTVDGSNGLAPHVASSHSRSLDSGSGGSNGGEPGRRWGEDEDLWLNNAESRAETGVSAAAVASGSSAGATPGADSPGAEAPAQDDAWTPAASPLGLPPQVWHEACAAWMLSDDDHLRALAEAHGMTFDLLASAVSCAVDEPAA